MFLSDTIFIGIETSSGRKPFTFAALDSECNLIALESGELETVLAFVSGKSNTFVTINGPRNPNLGLVKKELEEKGLFPGQMRGADLRKAEYLLREKGVEISPTPSKKELCPEWMQSCFLLFEEMDKMGFIPFPTEKSNKQYLESQSHAAFCALLGQKPLSKPTLEGRLQRQLALHEANVGVKNPMEFFEEITRHRLIQGILPVELVYFPEQLDAVVAAYVGYLAANEPKKITLIGSIDEGRIALPASELLEKY